MIDRPLSPHLQVYKLPLAAVISISHRIMGVVLFASAIVIALLCLAGFVQINLGWIADLTFSWLGKIKATWLITGVVFYGLSEVRYIIWGLNHGITPAFVNTSNVVIIALTCVISFMCWVKIWGGL